MPDITSKSPIAIATTTGRVADQTPALQLLASGIDADDLAHRVFSALGERLPVLGGLSAALVEEVRHAVYESVRALVDHLGSGERFDSMSERFTDIAARRATQGVSIDQSLLAYEIGSEVLLTDVLDRIATLDASSATGVLAAASQRILEFVQVATAAVASGYQAASAATAVDREHRLHAYLEVVAGRRGDPRTMSAMDVPEGIALPFRWCLASDEVGAGASQVVRDLRRHHPGALVGVLDGRVVMFIGSEQPPPLTGIAAGSAPVAEGDTARSFSRAVAASRVASHLGRARAAADETAPLAALLSLAPDDIDAFVATVLKGLIDPRHDDLLDSLRAYLAHGLSIASAARSLYVHRHTLDYRLRRIEELSGLDLTDPLDRFFAEIALFLRGRYP